MTSRSFDVVVCGGGVAGFKASTEAAQAGASVALIDPLGGGGRVSTLAEVVGWPRDEGADTSEPVTGADVAAELMVEALGEGVELVLDEVTEVRCGATHELVGGVGIYQGRALVIATGSAIRPLGVPGEAELQGRGVLQCATCDGPLYVLRELLVVGGGDSAVEEALFLATLAIEIRMVFQEDDLHCDERRRHALEAVGNVKVFPNCEVVEIAEGEHGIAVSVILGGAKRVWEAAAIFPYAGLVPTSAFLGSDFDFDDDGHLAVSPDLTTTVAGAFAAGDVRSGSSFSVVDAARDGVLAGKKAADYVEG